MGLKIDADLFLFDLDGTIYLDDKPIDGVIDTLKRLTQEGKKVCFLTNNSSKAKQEYLKKIRGMGYSVDLWQIITSTMASIKFLQTRRPGKSVYPVGTATFVKEVADAGIDISDDADIVLLGFDTTLTYEKIWHANTLLLKHREFITTHPDLVCPAQAGAMPDVGSFVAMFEAASGRKPNVVCGKPHEPMARIIESLFDVEPSRIAMVGDRLYTDILFGLNSGYQAILVFSGETTPQMLEESGFHPTACFESVAELYDD